MSLQPYTTLQIFQVLFREYHTDCLILDTPSWHLWGNLLDASLSGGPDIDNFLLDAYCWYGRHYGSSLHPPFSASLNFHSADGSQRTANRLVLHPTPEGPFHERSFSCMMQIYTARQFMAQPVFFQYTNSKYFQWSLRSERGQKFSREKWCSIIWTALRRDQIPFCKCFDLPGYYFGYGLCKL